MKMVKSLLLGSAAGVIAVAGAQAADLPVKAKAVEYVKICSLYGVGYYYIPGTDTCIKIGGYVRLEAYHNAAQGAYPTSYVPTANAITPTSPLPTGTMGGAFTGTTSNLGGAFDRHTNTFAMQTRFRLTSDVRTQTEYGTLRGYLAFGVNALNLQNETSGPALTVSMERAFIQFAGFTIGRADTFFAFYNGAAYGLVPLTMDGSSGPAGLNVIAYTWQFGNGLSASLSLEDAAAHTSYVIDLNSRGVLGDSDAGGQEWPDIVGNLRVDQAWGSAQIMGALHNVRARYNHTGASPSCVNSGILGVSNASTTACPYPSDEIGWAVGAGLTLKMPWDAKDTLSGVIAYSEGASRYVAFGQQHNFLHKQGIAVGAFTDAVFMNPNQIAGYNGGLELTEAWGGTIAFEHYWTPSLRTSWVAGYLNVSYGDTAKALLTQAGTAGVCRAAFNGGLNMANVTNCDPDWSAWRIASRTMWNPVANLDVGLEVAYSKINTAFAGTATVNAGNGLASGTYNIEDQDVWTATFRIQRSFWP